MRLVVYAFLLAVLALAVFILCFLVFEPTLGPMFAFWPGFLVQWLLEKFGLLTSNRILPWATLFFWWGSIWLYLFVTFSKKSNANKPT
jgi:hypothetical protein